MNAKQYKDLSLATLIVSHLFAIGCSEPQSPATTAEITFNEPEFHRLLRETAAIELRTLKLGSVSDEQRFARIQRRIKFLEQTSQGAVLSWTDENSTREDCLELESQLSALAIGRGFAGTADDVRDRMKRLQSLLNMAGYRFDERGFESPYGEDGKLIKGYVRLLDE